MRLTASGSSGGKFDICTHFEKLSLSCSLNLKEFRTTDNETVLGSVFWHQHLRKSLSAPADFLVYKVLRFPKGALFTRYLNLSLVFLFSGLLHESVNIAEGFHRPYAGSVIFFMTQALGIILEDAVQAVYRAIRGVPRGTSPTLLARAIGYVWLALFLCWSTPIWIYAQQSASRGEQGDNLLPFSLLGLLKNIPIPKSIIPLGHHKRD